MRKTTEATITALLCFAFGQLFAEESLTGSFVYPSETYSPECVKFCKENDVKRIYMHWTEAKKGRAAIYKEAGINVILSHSTYYAVCQLPTADIEKTVKKCIMEYIGENYFKDFDKFEIDEPHLGYGDWKNEVLPDVEKDQEFRKLYKEKFGKDPVSKRSMCSASDWRNILAFRQSLYWERLKVISASYKKICPKKGMELTVTPCAYESGPTLGVDINLLDNSLSRDINVMTDPYFQAFRRPLQWSGMIISWFRNANTDRKIGGVIQYYDAIKDSGWPSEGYTSLTPDQIDRQVFEYLMNGATDITVFTLGARIFGGKPEFEKHLSKSLRFVEESKKFWMDTKAESQVGIYFSENTFRMYDMWGPWSRMTGLYGTSFQTEWTYYALSARHIPADIISIAFNEEKGLSEKLGKYKTIIVPDTKCVSDYEAECFKKYVTEGGKLIISGKTSFHDWNGEPLKKASLSDLMGLKSIKKGNGKNIRFVNNDIIPAMAGKEISTDGNAAKLFMEQAARHPQWLKDKCTEKKYDGYDLKFAEKLPAASSLEIEPSTAKVIAVYSDKSAAITVNDFGKGKCIYIAPDDLTLFKGKVEDTIEENAASKENLDFMDQLVSACAGERLFELAGAEGIESAYRKSKDGTKSYIYLLNHADKTADGITLKLPGKAIDKVTIFDQESCSEKEIRSESGSESVFKIPAFKYGIIIEANSK